uniref:Alpha/beta hydrolase fold protein n=1 Tax=Cyanothece sp. (strain PCC 7425 / ATCC 29141) TaxID=395961 RepID=B8HXG3_CYAP4
MTTVDFEITLQPQTWLWRGYRINYVQKGERGANLVLVHGFGASTDHWRKNIAELSQDYRVWAIDLLGFGRSEKPAIAYTADLWRDQLQDFCASVVQAPVFIAGNSLGGYTVLCLAVDAPAQVEGVILLNCAGPFSDAGEQTPKSPWQQQLAQVQRQILQLPFAIDILSFVLFHYTRQKSRIRQILLQVYKDPTAVTDRLVEEIYRPAFDPGALGVFAAVFKSPPGRKLDQLLQALDRPLLLLWGTADPWMTPAKAEKFCQYFPQATLTWVDAGHCPHDELPQVVNPAIHDWIQQLQALPASQGTSGAV